MKSDVCGSLVFSNPVTEPTVVTARNDGLIISYHPVQLLASRGNIVMQYCVSKQKVIEYIAKYAAKCEPRSQNNEGSVHPNSAKP